MDVLGGSDEGALGDPLTAPTTEAESRVATVDVYVLRRDGDSWNVLLLQRAEGARCAGAWEVVHGRIETGERPEEAALREVREETGLEVARLYNVTVQPFYIHRWSTVTLAVVFAAIVGGATEVVLGAEHVGSEWLSLADAAARVAWPRSRAVMGDIAALFSGGDAGPLEDVLRVR